MTTPTDPTPTPAPNQDPLPLPFAADQIRIDLAGCATALGDIGLALEPHLGDTHREESRHAAAAVAAILRRIEREAVGELAADLDGDKPLLGQVAYALCLGAERLADIAGEAKASLSPGHTPPPRAMVRRVNSLRHLVGERLALAKADLDIFIAELLAEAR